MAVQMGVEGDAFLGDLAKFGQAEYLESATVCQDGPGPTGELMKPAHVRYDLIARTQMQMIGVAQHDLCADFFQIKCGKPAFDGGSGGDILESGGLNGTVNGYKFTAAGSALLFDKTVRHGSFSLSNVCCKKAAVQ